MIDEHLESVLFGLASKAPVTGSAEYFRFELTRLRVEHEPSRLFSFYKNKSAKIILQIQAKKTEKYYNNMLDFMQQTIQSIHNQSQPKIIKGLCELSLTFQTNHTKIKNIEEYIKCYRLISDRIIEYIRNPNSKEEAIQTISLANSVLNQQQPENVTEHALLYPFGNSQLVSQIWTTSLTGTRLWDIGLQYYDIFESRNRFLQN